MTQDQLDEILALPKIEDIVEKLSVSTYTTPNWSDLNKQYDPKEHKIITDKVTYPIIPNAKGGDDMKRITRALQKLAVNRMSQAMGSTPVERTYNYDMDSETQQKAIDIVEQIYKVQNSIDSENIERFKRNNASCQVATIWYKVEKESNVLGEVSKLSLGHTSYSEMDGYKIYANYDNNRNLLVLSLSYKDQSNAEYFDIYAGGLTPKTIRYKKVDNWELIKNETVDFYPVVHTWLNEPVWGGDSGTTQVEAIEETLSYRAVYIKKNAVPLATMDMGDTTNMTKGDSEETDEDRRRIVAVGKGGKIEFAVWDVNNGTVEQQIKDMENAFFDDNQIPNISFSNMLDSRTSADNKDIMLTDSKSKAIDLGGEWEKLFNDELNNIVIPFVKVMFPSYSEALSAISVSSKIKPFSIKSDKESSEFVANAGSSMSLETRVKTLNKVTNVAQEVTRIEEEQQQQSQNLL